MSTPLPNALYQIELIRRKLDRLSEALTVHDPDVHRTLRWSPAVDILEDADGMVIKIELPGVHQDEIDLTVSDTSLIIRGERRSNDNEPDKHYHKRERRAGRFERLIPLSVAVDSARVKATYKKGLLVVHLPKRPAQELIKVPITNA